MASTNSQPTIAHVQEKLTEALQPTHIELADQNSCGLMLDVLIVAEIFEGKTRLQRHRMVTDAIKEEMKDTHAITMKLFTPVQYEEKQAKQDTNETAAQ